MELWGSWQNELGLFYSNGVVSPMLSGGWKCTGKEEWSGTAALLARCSEISRSCAAYMKKTDDGDWPPISLGGGSPPSNSKSERSKPWFNWCGACPKTWFPPSNLYIVCPNSISTGDTPSRTSSQPFSTLSSQARNASSWAWRPLCASPD